MEISAHRLKSLVGSYNHEEARELAQTIEDLGKAGECEEAADSLKRLQPLIEAFTKAVRHYLEQQT